LSGDGRFKPTDRDGHPSGFCLACDEQHRDTVQAGFRRMRRIGCTEGWGVRLCAFGFDVVVEAAVQRQQSADYGKSYDVETVEKTHQDEETGDPCGLML
jgi:hypothetical protein